MPTNPRFSPSCPVVARWFATLALVLFHASAAGAPAEGPPFSLKDVLSGNSGWLMDDAGFVMAVDVKGVLDSRPLADSGVAALIAGRLIFDPSPHAELARTLKGVIVSASGLGDDWRSRVVLLGDFNVEKLSAAIRKVDGIKAEKAGGVEVFAWESPAQFGAFVGKTAFVMTRSKAETLDLARDGPPRASKQRKEMLAALKQFTGKECVVLALPISDVVRKRIGEWGPAFAAAFKSLNAVTLSLTDGKELQLSLIGRMEVGTAKKLATQLTGLKALGDAAISMMDNIPQPLKDMFEEIKIDNTRDTVTVGMKISAKHAGAFAKMFAQGGR